MDSTAYKTTIAIIKKLHDNGFHAYIVGGSVRDMLFNNSFKCLAGSEVDIATSARPEQLNTLFEKTYNIGAAFGIVNVIKNGISFEVATFREESSYSDGRHPGSIKYTTSPKKDAKRRDFTVNALFYDPLKNKVLDFTKGQEDLRKGILRTIGNPEKRFSEDYLRILRAIRFGVRFGFKFDKPLINAIKKLAPKVNELSKERIRDELNKIFTGPKPGKALKLLSEMGILPIILPEVEAMKGISQPELYHPEGDAFEHTTLMLINMVLPDVELAWAVLLHDVGKPVTLKTDENNVEHFFFHDKEGTLIAEQILKRLKFPNTSIKRICFAIKNHMRYAFIQKMKTAKLKRLIAEPTFSLEIELHRLDCSCSNKLMDNFLFLLDTIFEQKDETRLPPPLITGKDLIALGFTPGPKFGEILKVIEEKHIEEKLSSKKDAIKWIKKQYPEL